MSVLKIVRSTANRFYRSFTENRGKSLDLQGEDEADQPDSTADDGTDEVSKTIYKLTDYDGMFGW